MDFEIVKLFWEWYLPYNNQEIYKDDIAKMAFVAGYKAAQQGVQPTIESVGSAPAVVVESKVASPAESG